MDTNHKGICFFLGGDRLQERMLVPILEAYKPTRFVLYPAIPSGSLRRDLFPRVNVVLP
jgi:hypothetical protein